MSNETHCIHITERSWTPTSCFFNAPYERAEARLSGGWSPFNMDKTAFINKGMTHFHYIRHLTDDDLRKELDEVKAAAERSVAGKSPEQSAYWDADEEDYVHDLDTLIEFEEQVYADVLSMHACFTNSDPDIIQKLLSKEWDERRQPIGCGAHNHESSSTSTCPAESQSLIKPYPIGYHTDALRSGRHCLIADLDKGILMERLKYFVEEVVCQGNDSVDVEPLLLAMLVIGHHMGEAAPGKTIFPIRPTILQSYGTSLRDMEPVFAALQRANLFHLSYFETDDMPVGQFGIKPFGISKDGEFKTKIRRQVDQGINIPDGTLLNAMTMIVFGNHEDRVFNDYVPFVNMRPGEQDINLTIDFVINHGEHKGQFVSRDIPLGDRGTWGEAEPPDPAEYRQIANSAFNVFSFDDSAEANELRDAMNVDFDDTLWSLQEKVVVIEIGLATDGSGINYLKSIIQPEHPRYIEVMDLGLGISAGTGVFGDYVPSAELSSTGVP